MKLQEFRPNKPRTFLYRASLRNFKTTQEATISSMELAVKDNLSPRWSQRVYRQIKKRRRAGLSMVKYIKRPEVKYSEMKLAQLKSPI